MQEGAEGATHVFRVPEIGWPFRSPDRVLGRSCLSTSDSQSVIPSLSSELRESQPTTWAGHLASCFVLLAETGPATRGGCISHTGTSVP